MTTPSATDLLDRLQSDHDFAVEISRRSDDGAALQAYLEAEGFQVTEEALRKECLERYCDQLTPEQLDAVSGGIIPVIIIGILIGEGVIKI